MPEMPRRVEHLLQNLGQKVQKMHITEDDLERYLIVERDGELALYPKAVGPVSCSHCLIMRTSLTMMISVSILNSLPQI